MTSRRHPRQSHQARENATFVAELPRDQTGWDCHEEVGEVIGELNETRLLFGELEAS